MALTALSQRVVGRAAILLTVGACWPVQGAAQEATAILGSALTPESAADAAVEEPLDLPRGVVPQPTDFQSRQFRFERVRRAHSGRADDVRRLFHDQGVHGPAQVLFRVFKREQLLEVWAQGRDTDAFVLVNTYPVCGTSGSLGPKRRQGDGQIPEGFYSIETFNPMSQFHLSLRVDYPNAVDRAREGRDRLGGDIYIHGGCVTVGCVPVTDEWIEELYIIAMDARDAGQRRIPVHMFPTRLDEDGMAWLAETYGTDHPDFDFWLNLREGYLAFEQSRAIPIIDHHRGRYTFPRGVVTR